MNILDGLMSGLSAIADVVTIAPKSLDPVDGASSNASSSASPKPDPGKNESEHERIARERQAELEALADEQTQERTLKR